MFNYCFFITLILGHLLTSSHGLWIGKEMKRSIKKALSPLSFTQKVYILHDNSMHGLGREPKLEHYADKMREILPKIGWLLLLHLVCVLCQSA